MFFLIPAVSALASTIATATAIVPETTTTEEILATVLAAYLKRMAAESKKKDKGEKKLVANACSRENEIYLNCI